MSPQFPALAATLLVLVAAGLAAPSRRVRRPALPTPTPTTTPGAPARRAGPVTGLGRAVRQRVGGHPDPRLDRRMGWLILLCLLAAAVSPALSAAVAGGARISWMARRRRRRRSRDRGVVDELPEVVDLLLLAVSAGYTVPLAVSVVADHGKGQLASELHRARQATAVGASLADELDLIPGRLGERVRPVVRALSSALRDGAPLGPALERVAADVRTLRRRAAEERARRASVRLLFPLVCCTLPAFALLTVIPLLISTLRNISL